MSSDVEQERRRLTQLYSEMTLEELGHVVDDSAALTDVARDTLKTELARRGLAAEIDEAPADEYVLEERNLVSIRRFRDLHEALVAKGSLESSGIECFLADDNMIRMDWFISNLLGGIKLAVNQEDAEAAIAILDEPMPETLEVDGVGEYQQPRCPECRSLDVNFEQLSKIAYPSAWLGLPIPLHDKAWTCRSCGHKWEDQDSTDPKNPA
jgi:Putative prokaryotic signal transducing protein